MYPARVRTGDNGMSAEVERVKKLVEGNLVVDAIEIPSDQKAKPFVSDDLQEILSQFENDADYAHFVIRVKRSHKPLPKPNLDETAEPQISIDAMVSETLQFLDTHSEQNGRATTASEKEEHDPEFLFENARLLTEAKDFALARNIFLNMIKMRTRIPESLAGIAKTYDLEGDFEKAINYYQEAIAYSSDLSFHQSLAAVYIKTGTDEEACKILLHALGIHDLSSNELFDLHKTLGNCFTRIRQYPKAEHHYFKAFEINENSDALHVNVGSLALQKDDLLSALKHFHKALEINPRNERAICGVGMVQMAKGNIENAYGYFLKSLRINVQNLSIIYNLVKCAYELKKFDDVTEILRSYILSNTNVNSNVLYSYAGILFHNGQYGDSQKQVEAILHTDSTHAGALELGEILKLKLGSST